MDLFNLSAKLSLDDGGFRNGLKRAEGLGKGLANSISAKTIAMGQMLGNFATKAVSTVSSSLKELVKGSVDAYADYEQLVGGVETLFGTGGKSLEEYMKTTKDVTKRNVGEYTRLTHAQELVMENANNAYKTAGLSVNEYMETTTSFAAALVSSLKGDTYSAAVVADMAVQDMADNANKMGSSMESIQNAYQGFAKQNYTMLDNLKLGYGGTKKEMERLLKDAGKIAGKKYNLRNLADVYEAIHVIQTELGITGTTAKEAEGTISGSVNMMKAAWKNLLTAFGDPDANLSEKVDAFTKSVGTVVKNVFPVFKRVVQNIWDYLGDFGNSLGELVFGANEAGEVNWPTWDDVKDGAIRAWNFIKEQALNLGGLVFGKKEDGSVNWPTWEDVKTKAEEVWDGIKKGAKALGGLVFGTKEDGSVNWPTWEDVKTKAEEVWDGIKKGAKALGGLVFGKKEDGSVDWPDWSDVSEKAKKAWGKIKERAKYLAGLVFGRREDGSVAWPTWEDVRSKANEIWGKIKDGAKALGGLVFGTKEDGTVDWPTWDDVKTKASEAWDTIVEGVKTLGGLVFGTKEDGTVNWPTWKEVGQKANEAWNSIKEEAAKLTGLVFGDESAVGNFTSKLETLKNKWSELKETVSNNAIDFLSGLTGEDPEKVVSVLKGISDAVMSLGVGIGVFQIGTKLTGIVTAVQTLLSSGLSVSHPVLLAISALAAAGTLIYQNWDGISEFFQNLWSGISQWAGDAYKTVEKWWKEDIVKPIKEKWDEIVQKVQGVVADVQSAWNVIVEWFTNTIITPISNAWDGVLTGVNNAIGAVKTAWEGIVGWFEENIIGPIRSLWEGVAGMFGGSATANQAKGGRGVYSGQYGYNSGSGANPRTGRTALQNAKGSWSIPYDDYLARLHRGEMVLTASQARRYRDGEEGSSFDVDALVSSIVSAIQTGMQGVTVNSYLSGRSITDDVNRQTARQLKARRFAT